MFSTLDLLFSSTPLEGPEQMALDEVLLGAVSRPLLRVYRWKSPCVTFGYFQKQELVKSLYPNSSLVRRWSGGGCVEHGEDFTFSLMVPESEPVAKQRASLFYRALHEAIVVALQEHQIGARLATAEDQVVGASCFVAPCPCDVMLARIFHPSLLRKPGRPMDAALESNFDLNSMYSYSSASKLNSALPHQPSQLPRNESDEISGLAQKKIVGGAQRRSRGRLLHQGSLNLGARSWELSDGKKFFLSLAKQLAPEVALIEEKSTWLAEADECALERYRSREWLEKR